MATLNCTTCSFHPQEWLPAAKGKGLQLTGTFSRRAGQIYMDMTFTNKAMQPMSGFAIQLNKNRYDTKKNFDEA